LECAGLAGSSSEESLPAEYAGGNRKKIIKINKNSMLREDLNIKVGVNRYGKTAAREVFFKIIGNFFMTYS
jgi:hypothetical protein